MQDDDVLLGHLVKQLRISAGYKSQKDLAQASGVGASIIAAVEAGTRSFGTENLNAIADAVDATVEQRRLLAQAATATSDALSSRSFKRPRRVGSKTLDDVDGKLDQILGFLEAQQAMLEQLARRRAPAKSERDDPTASPS